MHALKGPSGPSGPKRMGPITEQHNYSIVATLLRSSTPFVIRQDIQYILYIYYS